MLNRFAVVLFLSVLLSPVAATESQSNSRRIERIDNIPVYIDRLHQTVQLARAGEYGKVKDEDMDRISVAAGHIENVLRDRKDDSGLSEEQRLELFNAQETISSILRDDEDSRIVCTREKGTGTRLTAKECMTVGQRKARAEQAREAASSLGRDLGCVRNQAGQCSQ
jgi:hypothetical protein